jgi:hypothetical protein
MNRRRHNRTPELIPEEALARMPKPIQEAEARLREASKARDAARQRVFDARRAVEDAPNRDGATEAALAGKKLPTATAPEEKAQLAAALEARNVIEADYDRKRAARDRAIAAHAREAVDAQHPAVEALRNQLTDLLEQATHVAEELDREAAVLVALASSDEYAVVTRDGSRRRYRRVGMLRFDGRRRIAAEVGKLISALGAATEQLGRPVTETVGERQEREQGEREARRANAYEQVRRGGAYVGS